MLTRGKRNMYKGGTSSIYIENQGSVNLRNAAIAALSPNSFHRDELYLNNAASRSENHLLTIVVVSLEQSRYGSNRRRWKS
jgi:hypothetical protein